MVVDGEVISGPPFHPNCKCSLSAADIESAPEQESNLGDTVGPGTYVSESTAWCWFEKHENDIIAIKDMLRKIGYEI